MAKSRLVKANEEIAEKAAVPPYERIERIVVGSYTKMEDAFVDRYLTKNGETAEEAKKRSRGEWCIKK